MELNFPLEKHMSFFGKEDDMARKGKTYSDLLKLAKTYGVEKNELFVQAAEQYSVQALVIKQIKAALEEEDGLLTSKEYVKGRENVYTHPLVRELPKHADSANKTLATMLEIITKLGKPPAPEGKLAEMMKDA